MIRSLDLFSGYGGLTMALHPWCKPIAYVEIEEYAQRIIAERVADGSLPRAPILADVKNIKGKPGDCDIIVGGFPCQDISVAGGGEGLAGERSGLFYEIARLTKEIQPSFIFLENVPAIRIRGLYHVAKEFTSMGYDCRWTNVSASHVSAPHKRNRFFLLAHANSTKLRMQSRRSRRKGGQEKILTSSACKDGEASNTPKERLDGKLWEEQEVMEFTELYKQKWKEVEPSVCGSNYGTTFGVDRLKALGNGVVPEQARLAFELLSGINAIKK